VKADKKVIEALQGSVGLHLLAIETYTGQKEHFERLGYSKLAERAAADVAEEQGHLSRLLARLEFYDTAPEYDHDAPEWPRDDYPGILEANLGLESTAAEFEREAVTTSREAGDELTAKLFAKNLRGSEDSVREITAIQKIIKDISLQNYLANLV
jgi:bacterioferritin